MTLAGVLRTLGPIAPAAGDGPYEASMVLDCAESRWGGGSGSSRSSR